MTILPIQQPEQHIYHHYDNDAARVTVKVERNSKGYHWEAAVSGAKTVDEAIALLKDAEAKLKANFGQAAPQKASSASDADFEKRLDKSPEDF
jgi:hypothetical protein